MDTTINNEVTITENLLQALNIFMKHFEPAYTFAESSEQLTTADISENLLDLLSKEEVSNSAICKILHENGYKYIYDDGFRWLLRIVPQNQ